MYWNYFVKHGQLLQVLSHWTLYFWKHSWNVQVLYWWIIQNSFKCWSFIFFLIVELLFKFEISCFWFLEFTWSISWLNDSFWDKEFKTELFTFPPYFWYLIKSLSIFDFSANIVNVPLFNIRRVFRVFDELLHRCFWFIQIRQRTAFS